MNSLRFRLVLLLILIGVIPCVLLRIGMLNSYENRAVSLRTSEILSQAKILANQIVSNDYLENSGSPTINAQLEQLSTIYDGRVMIISDTFQVVKDTYKLDEKKTIISEEVIKSFYGEEITKYDSKYRYIEMTIPLVRTDQENESRQVIGVMMVSVSTDSISLNLDYLATNTRIIELICIFTVIFASVIIAGQMVRPFHKMSKSIDEIQTGYGEDALSVNDYTETKLISEKFNKMLGRMKVLDDSRQEFVSNVSHELKTPIALIQGYAEGLVEGMAEDKENRDYYCGVIMDEAGKMNRMVRQLLTLTALEFGGERLSVERFDLTELIASVISSSGVLLKQNELTVDFDGKEPVYVMGDEFKIEEVITNYLTNAIHHVGGGEKKIQIRIDHRRDGKEVCVEVFNTGNPIPDEALPNLWTKFYKVDKARTREYGGSGIGLSIVKAIMEMHHKACGVKNHENGVEFWFTLDTAGEK